MHATETSHPSATRAPLTLARHPSATERATSRRRIAAGAVAAALAVTGAALAYDGSALRAVGWSLAAGVAVLAFVGLAYGAMLAIVVVLEPLARTGKVSGYALEGALHALLPFALVTAFVAMITGLPEGGALHLRAVPVLAVGGAMVGVLRWFIAGRGKAAA